MISTKTEVRSRRSIAVSRGLALDREADAHATVRTHGIVIRACQAFILDMAVAEKMGHTQLEAVEAETSTFAEPAEGDRIHRFNSVFPRPDERQFDFAGAERVIRGFSLIESNLRFHREHCGEKLAKKHEHDASVDEEHSRLPPTELEPADVCGEQVQEQQRTEKHSAGEGDGETFLTRHNIEPCDPGTEKFQLHLMDAHLDLQQGGHEN